MKKIATILLTGLLLVSCTNNSVNNDTENTTTSTSKIEGLSKEQRDETVLSVLTDEDRQLLEDYQKAESENNLEQREILLEKINTLIDSKEKEIEELEKAGDIKKVKYIKRELRAFYIISRGK